MLHYRNINTRCINGIVRLNVSKTYFTPLNLKRSYASSPLNTEKMLQFYKSNYEKYNKRRYYKYYALGSIIAIGVVGYNTSETVNATFKYGCMSVKRIYTVTSALTKCIYFYSMTISQKEQMSIEDYSYLLTTTHKKAADVTLDAIQQNVSIYIKLSPTHISNDISVASGMDQHYDTFTTRMY